MSSVASGQQPVGAVGAPCKTWEEHVSFENKAASSIAGFGLEARWSPMASGDKAASSIAGSKITSLTSSQAAEKNAAQSATTYDDYRTRLESIKARALNLPMPGEFGSSSSPRHFHASTMSHFGRARVGTAKYEPSRLGSPLVGSTGSPLASLRSSPRGDPSPIPSPRAGFKTERWRESGLMRWPNHALQEYAKQPAQFDRDVNMVPLQQAAFASPRKQVADEIWCRSLRAGDRGIRLNIGGMRNQELTTAAESIMFDTQGIGWTGRSNGRAPANRVG
jgi:hypothetical protein